mgnify:CR=1 FL=1
MHSQDPLLAIQNLSTFFHTEENIVRSVRNVDLTINSGETLALVGESGCGKSVTALSAMRLIPIPPGKFENGRILFKGKDLLQASELEMQKIRGNEISMIFQEPMTSLNPIFTIGDQITEAICLHQDKSLEEANILALEVLKKVAMPSPEQRINQYPHELSGGMKQRVTIAMGISLEPKVILADEPTSALDVVVQRHVMDTLQNAQEKIGAGLILVGHDMGLMAQFVHRIGVMYAGKLVEIAPVKTIFKNPIHPYTKMLIRSLPKLDSHGKFFGIPGLPPALLNLSPGCTFCERIEDFSHVGEPVEWTMISKDHEVLMCGGCEKK